MTKQISLRLDEGLIRRLDSMADRLSTTRNALCDVILAHGLVALETENVFRVIGEAMAQNTHNVVSAGHAEAQEGLRNLAAREAMTEPADEQPGEDVADTDPEGELAPENVEQPHEVSIAEDVWSEDEHRHRFTEPMLSTEEYRQGLRFALHRCNCGAVSTAKARVR